MAILLFILLFPICAVFCGFIVGVIDTFNDYLDECQERRKRRKELDEKIKLYTAVYADESDDFQKGYWLARIWNLQHERKCL